MGDASMCPATLSATARLGLAHQNRVLYYLKLFFACECEWEGSLSRAGYWHEDGETLFVMTATVTSVSVSVS